MRDVVELWYDQVSALFHLPCDLQKSCFVILQKTVGAKIHKEEKAEEETQKKMKMLSVRCHRESIEVDQ